MAERRKLAHRVQSPEYVNPEAMRAFVTQERKPDSTPKLAAGYTQMTPPVGLIPVTVRLSPEIAGALRRASLERQLARAEYFSQQEIVERCLRVWLHEHGHLS